MKGFATINAMHQHYPSLDDSNYLVQNGCTVQDPSQAGCLIRRLAIKYYYLMKVFLSVYSSFYAANYKQVHLHELKKLVGPWPTWPTGGAGLACIH